MSRYPKVAIVGRPNVGKSALFNRIVGARVAIVDEAEGITRDRIYHDSECFGKHFTAIDTGGIDPHSTQEFNDLIRAQAVHAIEEADSIIMVVDSRIGVTSLDQEVATILHRTTKPVCLAVNKVDAREQEAELFHPFYSLGIPKMQAVSALQGRNIAELLQLALNDCPEEYENEKTERIKIAIVGQTNVGKSTLLNQFLNEERCIASPIPGTTRDSIDVDFSYNNHDYTLIDTAGIRRKHAEHEAVDKFAAIRTKNAIERSDICLLMIDAVTGLNSQTKKIISYLEEIGRGCILLFNKWDLVKGSRMEHCLKSLFFDAPFLKHCPVLFISAKTARNMDKIFPEIENAYVEWNRRVSTGELNRFVEKCLQAYPPPMITGKRLRIYYLTQVNVAPPRFVFFINYADRLAPSYYRYLVNQFRKEYGFRGVPLVFHLKAKQAEEFTPRGAKAE